MKEERTEPLHSFDNVAEQQHFEHEQQLSPWERPALWRLEANMAAFTAAPNIDFFTSAAS